MLGCGMKFLGLWEKGWSSDASDPDQKKKKSDASDNDQ